MTQKEAIIAKLSEVGPGTWLAVHEFGLIGMSENSIASRLPEQAKAGLVTSRMRDGKPYKEWALAPIQRELFQ